MYNAGVATGVTCTIAERARTCNDIVIAAAFLAGERISIGTSGTDTTTGIRRTIVRGTRCVGAPTVRPAMSRPPQPPRRPRTIDPRLIAPLAFILAVIAMGLVIVYTIGRFVESTLQAVPVG